MRRCPGCGSIPSKPATALARNEEEMELAISLPVQPGATASRVRPDHDDMTDGDLLDRIAARDAGAFEVLYRRYARSVYGLALRMLGDRGRAEDAVQETFT